MTEPNGPDHPPRRRLARRVACTAAVVLAVVVARDWTIRRNDRRSLTDSQPR